MFIVLLRSKIGAGSEGIPDRELESVELISGLRTNVEGVDESQRELEYRQKEAQLRPGNIAGSGQIPPLLVAIREAAITEEDEPDRIRDLVDVLGVHDVVLIAACASQEALDIFLRSQSALLESAH